MYGDTRVRTPAIDSIATEGVAFDAGYVTASLCSPSRAAFLTGRYQQRFGHEGQPHERYATNWLEYVFFKTFFATGDWTLTRWVAPDREDVQRQGLPKSEVTLAEVFKHAGYATAAIGKWHLGWNPDFQPHNRGFDEHFGFYEAYSLYYADMESPRIVNVRHDDFSERFIWGKERRGTAAIRRNDAVVDEEGYLTDRFADESIAFIEENRGRPFFLYVPFSAPHTPFQAKKQIVDRFASEPDENRRVYLAMIASLDEGVGRILAAIDSQGLRNNTLVVFFSDNGAALYTHATTNDPFKAGKFANFEGGVRVPFAMRWPGHLPAGVHYDQPVSALDIFATTTAAAGADVPKDRPYDGVDLVPFLRGEAKDAPHDALYWRAEYAKAVRKGRYKLVVDERSGAVRLYDLSTDPGEHLDLSAAKPDVVADLRSSLAGWESQCRAPLWPYVMDYAYHDEDGQVFWYPL